MKQLIKNPGLTFHAHEWPEGLLAIRAVENKFFVCDHPTQLDGAIPLPDELWEDFIFYDFKNGKKLWYDPFQGKVQFSADVDAKNRRETLYSPEQLSRRVEICKWLMLNVWLPEMSVVKRLSREAVHAIYEQVCALQGEEETFAFRNATFYYDL